MKSSTLKIFMSAVAILFVAAPSSSFGGWVLYDNFNSGVIDPDKWDLSNISPATITVENGCAKFVHDASEPNKSAWLSFKKSPEKIKAIRVKVKMADDKRGDIRGRIGGFLGQNEVRNPVWLQMQLRNEYDRVEASALALTDTTSAGVWLYDLFYSHVGKPDGLVGNWYVLEMYFNRYSLLFKGNGVGFISHVLTEKVSPLDNYFKGIGTRNGVSTDKTFTVYFDDVYVLY